MMAICRQFDPKIIKVTVRKNPPAAESFLSSCSLFTALFTRIKARDEIISISRRRCSWEEEEDNNITIPHQQKGRPSIGKQQHLGNQQPSPMSLSE